MLASYQAPRWGTTLIRVVASVLIAIIAAPRLAALGDSLWWTLLPWVLLTLGWGVLIVRWRRAAKREDAPPKDASGIDTRSS